MTIVIQNRGHKIYGYTLSSFYCTLFIIFFTTGRQCAEFIVVVACCRVLFLYFYSNKCFLMNL